MFSNWIKKQKHFPKMIVQLTQVHAIQCYADAKIVLERSEWRDDDDDDDGYKRFIEFPAVMK